MEKDGRGSPRPAKNVVKETDLSDGRDEADKIKEQLEKEKAEQLRNIEIMKEWKRKQEEKEKEGSGTNAIIDKMRLENARARQHQEIDESGNSSSLSAPKTAQQKSGNVDESYTTDEFEESVSASGSGSKKFERLFQGASAAKRAEAPKVTTTQPK